MTSRRARLVRATLAAAVTTFVAALSHSFAGEDAPGSLAIVVSLLFTLLLCLPLTRARMSTWRLALVVVAGQVVYHGLFTLFGGSGWGPAGAASGAVTVADAAGHDHAAMMARMLAALQPATPAAGPTGALAGTMGGDFSAGMWMTLAHLVAAVVTIAALRRGERTFWSLVEGTRLWVRRLLATGAASVTLARPRVTAPPAEVFAVRPVPVLVSSLRHRGPPAASAV